MVDVARGGAAAGQATEHNNERRVEERHDEDQDGRDGSARGVGASDRNNRATREDAADSKAAAVAHEQLCRRSIPAEESDKCAG
jgi:hypothetical protein